MVKKVAVFGYGLVAYAAFFVTILYAIGFVANLWVPKGIDSGTPVGLGETLLVNLGLLGLFALQHTIMARPAFKRAWTRVIPKAMERSTFVLASSLILLVLFWQWRPVPTVVWEIDSAAGTTMLWAVYWLGWGLVFASSFIIDHFDLFGLRHVTLYARGREYTAPKFQVTSLYRIVRHPLLLGFLLAFWSAPTMTVGRLMFALATTGYILIGIRFEERDLRRAHGDAYEAYRRKVPMLVPRVGAAYAPTREGETPHAQAEAHGRS